MQKFFLTCGLVLALLGSVMCDDAAKTEEGTDTHEATEAASHDATAETAEVSMDTVTTETGLKYIDLKLGEGAEATAGQRVSMHYTGWLKDDTAEEGKGTKFDSSHDRNQPFQFALGARQVIAGWDEGIQGMKVGGQRRLIIPAALGYGDRGAGGVIPPGADLIFDVEFLGFAGEGGGH